ncbi:hypothetical protein, partial [Anaerobiospirillum succiniciproducens]|uniref:beta strand repeat-containing protein n=1 Tax=Anaerobiospirillum succiniciproducens TaxID=13335 RepID=UPI002942A081
MKQTNNAIKFLMAQYRAIFKNANIAMVAAMVAAALAAGQAQAAPDAITDWNLIASGTIDANTTNGKALAIVADADKTESKGFDLTITSGSHTIKGKSGQNELTTAKDKTTTITLSGDGTAVAQPTLKIGTDQASEHVAVTITNLNNYAGTVTIEGNGAASSLTATNIQIGGSAPASDGAAKAAAASKAVVSLGASGEIIAAKGGTFNILNGGELKFAGAASKAQAESGITLNGGKISVADSATGTVDGALTVTNGAVVVVNGGAADTTLTVSGLATINDGTFDVVKGGTADSGGKAILSKGITMNGGILTVQGDATDVKSGKLVVTGAAKFNKGSKLVVEQSGAATFNGDVTLADGTIENAGTVALNMAEGATSTLTVGADSLAELLKGKVSGSGATSSSGKTETLKLVIDSDVDLVKAGLVDEANGNAKANFAIDSSVENTSLTAKNVTIGAGTYAATKSLTVDSLTAGNEGAFTVGKDLTATVKNGLTVTAKGEKADLTVNGILNLEGAGSVIGANKIELAQDSSGKPTLNVNKGTWGVKDLTLTSGAATVTGEGTKLNVNGMLTTTTNGSLAIKNNAVVDASSGDLTLVAEKVDLTGGSTLILDSADVFKIDGGTVTLVTPNGEVKSKFEQGAVKTDGTSILQLNYSGNLAVADLDKIKKAIDASTSTLKGFIRLEGANITGKPTEDVTLTEAKEGFDGLYDNVAIKVDTAAGTVNKSLTAAQIKLTNASATGAAIADSNKVLLKGDGKNGNFVMKSGGEVADVSLGSGSALVLAGSGKVGDIKATAATNTGKASLSIGHSAATGTVNAKSIDGGKAGLDVSVFNSTLNVAGKVAAKDLTLDGSALKITAEAGSGSVSADTLSVGSGSSISAAGQEITISGTTAASEILGDVTAQSLSLGAKGAEIAGDAVINLDKLALGTGLVQVGNDAAEKNGSATVVVQNLTGEGTLFVDPKYTEKAALVIANNLSGSSIPDNEQDAGTLQGSAIVGNNAALGIGFASEAELKAVLGQFLDANGSFTEDPDANKLELANALVLNKHIDIADTKGILVKKGATKNDTPSGNSVTLESGTGLIITDNVYKVLDDGSKSGAAITFGASGTVSSSGGKVILSGNF